MPKVLIFYRIALNNKNNGNETSINFATAKFIDVMERENKMGRDDDSNELPMIMP
ncbi:MAG: hypothetical protein WC878_04015 [Candidatus Paceibacterota bacterium]